MSIIYKIALIAICFLALKKYEIIDIDIKTVLFVCLVCIIMSSNTAVSEGFDTSNEAVQTVASVYNSGKLTVNELNVTGTSSFTGASTMASLNLLPRGVIVAWNGEAAPAGWAICNGENGTPDLRGRFIRMKNDDATGTGAWAPWVYGKPIVSSISDKSVCGNSRTDQTSWLLKFKLGDMGGTDHQVLTVDEIPPHNHDILTSGACFKNGGCDARRTLGSPDGGGNTEMRGSGWGHNNMPPFFVLTYIMKL